MTLDADKAMTMAREAFTSSTSYFDSGVRGNAEAAIRQFQGIHPRGSKYHSDTYKSRSRFFRPKTRTTIRKNEASAAEAFFSTNDTVNIEAEDDGDDDKQLNAEIMQGLVDYRLKKTIPWFLTCIGAYQDAQTVGVCISYQWWEYNPKKKRDRPCIDLLPIENFRFDAGADWRDPVNTSPYIIQLLPMYVKDVRAKMSTPDDKTGQPTWKKVADAELLAAQNAYGDTTRMTREKGRPDSRDTSQGIRDFATVWVHRNVIDVDGQDYVFYTLGTTQLLTNPVPIDQLYHHGERPWVLGFCILETHKTYPDGVAGVTKDVQGEINEVANQRIDNVKFAMNKRYFGKRGTQIDLRSLTRNVPGSITMMNDPEKDVIVHSTPDVTQSAYQEQDRLNLDFDDVAGAFSASSVQSNRKLNETVGGMNLLEATGNQVGGYQLRTFVETWVEPVLRQVCLLERHYETDDVLLALAGKKSAAFKRLNHDMVTDRMLALDTDLNCSVGLGATSPTEQIKLLLTGMQALKEVLADGLLERYGLDVTEVIKEVFGKLGHKDGKRFFRNVANEDPALTAAKAQVQELMQQLQAKQPKEIIAATVRKLDAETKALGVKADDVKAGAIEKTGRAVFAAGQTAQMIAAVPQLAPVIDAVLGLIGYVEPAGAELPQLDGALPGLVQGKVKNPKDGIEFTPGAAAPGFGAAPGDTSPQTPASPGVGAEAGINTVRAEPTPA